MLATVPNRMPGSQRHARRLAAAALLAASALGCRSAAPAGAAHIPPPGGAPAAVAATRVDSARSPYTDADVHFMTAMIGHHSQAIVMARMAPTHAASPSVRNLAERIVNAQQDEIRTMQRWLRDRAKPVPEPDTASAAAGMAMPMGHMDHMGGHDHAAMMPGMLTPAQLQQLDSARGPEFDRLFLRYMIQHHRGALSMVQQLFGSYGAAQDQTVFKFASDVNVDQTTEIARMERMLGAILFEPGAP